MEDKAVEPDGNGLGRNAYPLLLDISSLELTDRQLEKLFADNGGLQFELTAKGELVIMAAYGISGF